MDILAELARWNFEVDSVVGNTARFRCVLPEHEDKNPSVILQLADTEKYQQGQWYCPVCATGGDIYRLLGLANNLPGAVFRRMYDETGRKVNVKNIQQCYYALCKAGHVTVPARDAMRELEKRAVSKETLDKYMIGFDSEKKNITIPIQWGSRFVNVRRYTPGGTPKFQHYARGFGKINTLFPQDQITYNKIVICGGEIKALAVLERLNAHGIGAISQCNGENNWNSELTPYFLNKKVWLCYDIDATGQKGADTICALLKNKASWVGKLVLPLEAAVYPNGDVNDYFGDHGASTEDFLKLLEDCEEWVGELQGGFNNEEPVSVPLKALSGYKRPFNFRTTAYISGIDDSAAYKLPVEIKATCTNDSKVCSLCKLQQMPGFDFREGHTEKLDGRNPDCLRIIGMDSSKQRSGYKHYLGIPDACEKCNIDESDELLTVRYALLSDTEADTDNPVAAAIITEGSELHYGDVCYVEGRADKSPLTTEEVRFVTKHKPRDILSEYKVSDSKDLEKFRPKDGSYESLDSKLNAIYHDLERNVTFIYGRKNLHILFDLAFHSPLWFQYANALEPGWVSVLIVSETAQGKSTIMRRLLQHYGYGAYIDAANTTIAGLIGGVKTVGKRQFLKWGVLPQNDKRLVCIEEYANAPVELLRAMRAARDSGVVKLDKIDKGAAKARTRTIVLSNPKRIVPHGAVADGLTLMEDLVDRPEDLRRFDVGMWVSKLENEEHHEASTPVYSDDACHELITWVWTVPPENIVFTEGAIRQLRQTQMTRKYPFLHLVGGREFEVKLARLSAALAARVYSEQEGNLIVEARHVAWIEKFLDELYSEEEFGYASRLRNEAFMDEECTKDQLVEIVRDASDPNTFIEFLTRYNRYRYDDLKAAVGDSYTYERTYQQLLIMGCLVPEEDTRWNHAYLPTRRLKKLLPELKQHFIRYKVNQDSM